jgi:hypothetical protein
VFTTVLVPFVTLSGQRVRFVPSAVFGEPRLAATGAKGAQGSMRGWPHIPLRPRHTGIRPSEWHQDRVARFKVLKRLKRRIPPGKEVFVSHPRRRAKAPSVVGWLISETNAFYCSISCIYPRFGAFRYSRFEALVSGANHAVFLAASETRAFFKRSRSFRP